MADSTGTRSGRFVNSNNSEVARNDITIFRAVEKTETANLRRRIKYYSKNKDYSLSGTPLVKFATDMHTWRVTGVCVGY